MDWATMSSDVIGDFQEPYRAVLVDGDDIAALPSTAFESGAESARAARGWRQLDGTQPFQRNPRSYLPHYRDS